MGDSRRSRRPDSHQMWDESDRRDRRGGHNRDNDRDRRGYRSRSRERRGYRDRSRSPERRHRDRDRDGDRNRPRDRGPRHHDDRDRRDRRREDAEDAPPRQRRDERREDDRDKRSKSRRSASPQSRSPTHEALPTRPRPDAKRPAPNMSFNVGSRASRSPPPPSRAQHEEETNRSEEGQASEVEEDPMDAEDDDMAAMQAMMGFGGFGTTKNKKVSGNNAGGVHKEKKTEYPLLSRSSFALLSASIHIPSGLNFDHPKDVPVSSAFTTQPSIYTSPHKLPQNIYTSLAMAILATFLRSFEGVILSITAIHIVLTTLSNWICRPATPTPEELIRSRRENHTAGRSAVNRVVEAVPRAAAGKHPYHKPCHSWWWYAMALWPAPSDRLCRKPRRKWWWYIVALWPARDDPNRWFILITALSISILTFVFFFREIFPDIYQGHVRFFTVLSFLALEVGRAAYFYHLLKDCSVLIQEVCIGLMGHVTGGFCRLGSLFAVPPMKY
ncbi:hypothetical protein FPRO04_03227 [Fusarium proliferatum]|nr:hypothetical protein FPRO03_05158 [Fusarium proliferatum]KAG4269567.1 hypothetical protein FPRO04_03227 [Fusarium proliferatum]